MPGKPDGPSLSGRTCIIICAGLLLFSCRPPPSSQPSLPVDILLREIDSASARLHDFRGSASVETSFDGRRGKASLRIRYLNPDRYRIDVDGALFQVLAVLLIHDRHVQLYMPRENTVFEGTLDERDARIPGLDLTLEDVRNAVTGVIEHGRYPGLPVVDYIQGRGSAAVTVDDGGVRRTLWIDTGKMAVLREASESGEGRESVVRTFDRYRKRNGIWRPGFVRIVRNGSAAGTIELTYKTQSVNRGLRSADLDVRLPETVMRRPLADAAPVYENMDAPPVP